MYKCGIVTNKGRIEAKQFSTRDEVDNYILSFENEEQITHFRIEEKINDKWILIETEQGKK